MELTLEIRGARQHTFTYSAQLITTPIHSDFSTPTSTNTQGCTVRLSPYDAVYGEMFRVTKATMLVRESG